MPPKSVIVFPAFVKSKSLERGLRVLTFSQIEGPLSIASDAVSATPLGNAFVKVSAGIKSAPPPALGRTASAVILLSLCSGLTDHISSAIGPLLITDGRCESMLGGG